MQPNAKGCEFRSLLIGREKQARTGQWAFPGATLTEIGARSGLASLFPMHFRRLIVFSVRRKFCDRLIHFTEKLLV